MKKLVILCCTMILPALLIAQHSPKQGAVEQIQKMHQDPKAYIAMLENPQRDQEQKS